MSAPNVPRSRVVKGYRDLVVWQRAMDLVTATYRLTASFPRDEKYGLVQQLNKAAVSVPSNIAEGHGRDHLGDYLHHLSVANGSLMEVETQLMIAGRLGYLSTDVEDGILAHTAEVGRMLSGLTRALRKRRRPPLTPRT
jgi:four helix bundle protein